MLSSSRSKPLAGSRLPLETTRDKGGAAVASNGEHPIRSSRLLQLRHDSAANPHGRIYEPTGSGDQANGNWVEANSDGILVVHMSAAVISQNGALNNSQIGISVAGGSTGQVSGNVANGNANDGINTIDAGSALTLSGNRASFNVALGINAAEGVKDNGGNVVQDNATAQECKNIACAEASS